MQDSSSIYSNNPNNEEQISLLFLKCNNRIKPQLLQNYLDFFRVEKGLAYYYLLTVYLVKIEERSDFSYLVN